MVKPSRGILSKATVSCREAEGKRTLNTPRAEHPRSSPLLPASTSHEEEQRLNLLRPCLQSPGTSTLSCLVFMTVLKGVSPMLRKKWGSGKVNNALRSHSVQGAGPALELMNTWNSAFLPLTWYVSDSDFPLSLPLLMYSQPPTVSFTVLQYGALRAFLLQSW